MYELFLTAAVKDSDLNMACAVLQGVTWMTARQNVYLVSFYAGQPTARGLPTVKTLVKEAQQAQTRQPAPSWDELHQYLSKSSYTLQLEHELSLDDDFGKGVGIDLDRIPGKLRWTDFPEPLRDSFVTQRLKMEIPNQRNLHSIMGQNKFLLENQLVLVTRTFVRENVEFVLSQYYNIPGPPNGASPTRTLPSWPELQPVDSSKKWVFGVRLFVVEEKNQPEKLKKAYDELMTVKDEFDQLVEFKIVDRRLFDTRVTAPHGG